jgi:hypothetical protein
LVAIACGLRLRAVRDVLRQARRGKLSLEDWLGLRDHLRTPWSEEAPLLLSEAELHEHIGERPPGFVGMLIRADLACCQGDRLPAIYIVPSPGLLDLGLKLHDVGVEIETVAEAAALIRKRLHRVNYRAAESGCATEVALGEFWLLLPIPSPLEHPLGYCASRTEARDTRHDHVGATFEVDNSSQTCELKAADSRSWDAPTGGHPKPPLPPFWQGFCEFR